MIDIDVEVKRAEVVEIAKSWIGAKYHLGAMVRKTHADCATFLLMVLQDAGLITDESIGLFRHNWFANTSEDLYKLRMLRHATAVAEQVTRPSMNAEPGNIILTKAAGSRVYNHGAIITKWPMGIHAVMPNVCPVNLVRGPMWCGMKVVVLDPYIKLKESE